ncbi:MAG: signal recognition particle receptor subunit alpha, partial [Parafannyhessea umbonata]|uniref:signal recognition particle receptor subunit alpha n=1 Tax=Parafannyhessea umbonata TaxID=604330 RepID=UPI0026EF28E0
MGMFDSLKRGLARSREALAEVFYMGGEVDEDFWEDLEDRLVMGDMGAEVAMQVTDDLREQAAREGLKSARQLRDALAKRLAAEFAKAECDPFEDVPSCVLFVGINGAGKTTTVGKLAKRLHDQGKKVILVAADTFRAGAVEQLVEWGKRVDVPVVRGKDQADPAAVVYDGLTKAIDEQADYLLVDTAGRLQNKVNLMNELEKIQ